MLLQMPWVKMERERHNRDLSQEETEKRTRQAVERDARRQQRYFEDMGDL